MSYYRFLEMVPGLLAWSTLILMVVLSSRAPAYVAIFIILFDAYWFFKTIYFTLHLQAGFKEMRENLKVDWLNKVRELKKPWEQIYHLVIFPMYKEPYSVIEESLYSFSRVNYLLDKFIVVLGIEERAGQEAEEVAKKIKKEFGGQFCEFLITVHPKNLPNEIPGKGSNETWAAKEAKRLIIDPKKIPYENILVSTFDADTQVFPEYFARLTYVFLTAERPERSSYQPISFFTNNIFEAPIFARIISFSSTFWHIMNQARPEKLITFSSHSMPFKALVEIGFWTTNHVSEDSIIFYQLYLHYNGDWRVTPLGYPVSMDSNVAPTFWETLKNIYKQQRRWGWGAENVPYLIDGFFKNKKIPILSKIKWSLYTIDLYWEWATNAILIFALGWLPVVLGGEAFNLTLLSYSLPEITRNIMILSSFGIISSAALSMLLLPPRPAWFRAKHYFLYIFQWLLMPVTLIVFGAIPGLEAQTRLMVGGKFRLGFWPTPKTRVNGVEV
ncbi:MAG: glycosyltransferase family 2 protein [Candidatus Colwellbacteria bacterium]|nr:glycosyltransferase family 2 protein [Candidatus Colwellbacteria bacterium]